MLLAACGDGDEEADAPSPSNEPQTRRVTTGWGAVDVPRAPKRVVVFDRRGTLGYLLDLGIKPIAALSAPAIYGKTFHPLLEADTANITPLDYQTPDIEKVLQLKPDLIVGYRAEMEKSLQLLSNIAPSVSVPIDFNNPQEELKFLAPIFGLETKADALIKDFEGDIVKAKAKLKAPGKVSILLPQAENVRIYNGKNLLGQIVSGLGGTVGPDITKFGAEPTALLANVSYEQLSVVDGDTIALLVNYGEEWMGYIKKLTDMPVFKSLPAARNNRIIQVESQATFGTAGLRGQRSILEVLTKAFA
jgi:iron complex transport system substrate-binding protein